MPDPNTLAAFLYMCTGDQMPEPILNADNEIDVEADNLQLEVWSAAPDVAYAEIADLAYRLPAFIEHTENLLVALQNLELDSDEPAPAQYMTLFYDAAKATFDHDKSQLRTYFAWLYYVLYQRPSGSRWGDMVDVMGVDRFVETVQARLDDLFG